MTSAYLALLPQFYLTFNANNRYELQWNRADHLAVLISVCILGILYFVLYHGISIILSQLRIRLFWLNSITCIGLYAIVLRTVFSIIARSSAMPTTFDSWLSYSSIKLLVYIVFPATIVVLYHNQAKYYTGMLILMLSPLLAFGVVLPLTYHSFDERIMPPGLTELRHIEPDVNDTPSVYFILFDEWSYSRTFMEGKVRESMPNLKQLAATATLFHRAYAPGKYTWTSVPRYLLQNDIEISNWTDDKLMKFLFSGGEHQGLNIFSSSDSTHLSVIVGGAFDYGRLLGYQIDRAIWRRTVLEKPAFGAYVRILLATQFSWLRLIGLNIEYLYSTQRLSLEQIRCQSNREIQDITLNIVQQIYTPIVLFIHYLLPKPVNTVHLIDSLEHYENSLKIVDGYIGELMTALVNSGKWNDSLIILTSDHSWRTDPNGPLAGCREYQFALEGRWGSAVEHDPDPLHPWKHVPLIIKLPGQRTRSESNEVVFTKNWFRMMEAVLERAAMSREYGVAVIDAEALLR